MQQRDPKQWRSQAKVNKSPGLTFWCVLIVGASARCQQLPSNTEGSGSATAASSRTLMKYSRNYPAGQFSYFLLMESRSVCVCVLLTRPGFLNMRWRLKSSWTEGDGLQREAAAEPLQPRIIITGPAADLTLQEVNSFRASVSWSGCIISAVITYDAL